MSTTPQSQKVDALYEKCAHCHLFVEVNTFASGGDGDGRTPLEPIAGYDHLHRGDDADEEVISTHEATPSGLVANLATWKTFGPLEMRQRFEDHDPRNSQHVVVIVDPEVSSAQVVATYADALAFVRENFAADDDVDDDELIEFAESQGLFVHVQEV